jgi:hypothetical protein
MTYAQPGGVTGTDGRLGHGPDGLARARRPGGSQDGGRRPAPGGPIEDLGGVRADHQFETGAAQLERLVRGHGEVGRG